ncbi:hypothetical protein PF005_g10126 [Phytophthora fragariae]|uniref:Uncharacterized protein n=1 Tax=Phytophthora fragariae TaxID=53985 RepID=A0A6A3Y7Q0_9STRA|nr:hypothetical protein PF009_g11204 [Phytophthora fragariae]KAE9115010.1 hypothetical protein PF007_g10168 [Phytophthora fragariae]KAE9213647.1 hypothetical protein PF005_g10126 [Phytophthora fragariae]KAE9242994.1 hypothetical protein PF002_g8462 [Phytophthora fragariae]KAE9312410.1 hypothetical protein PF001_g9249 [Phytophthora fragariae]
MKKNGEEAVTIKRENMACLAKKPLDDIQGRRDKAHSMVYLNSNALLLARAQGAISKANTIAVFVYTITATRDGHRKVLQKAVLFANNFLPQMYLDTGVFKRHALYDRGFRANGLDNRWVPLNQSVENVTHVQQRVICIALQLLQR